MEGIVRTPTDDERADFYPVIDPKKKGLTPEEKFNVKLQQQSKESTKKGLPFAAVAARNDFEDYRQKVENEVKRRGFIPKDFPKGPEINWAKYSDLKNFELLNEGERYDEHLSKRNPGVSVVIKWKKYQFKGYSNTYRVMEEPQEAVARARKETSVKS